MNKGFLIFRYSVKWVLASFIFFAPSVQAKESCSDINLRFKAKAFTDLDARILRRKIPAPRGLIVDRNYFHPEREDSLEGLLASNHVQYFPSLRFPIDPRYKKDPAALVQLIEARKALLLSLLGEERRGYLSAIDSPEEKENRQKIFDYYLNRRWVPFVLSTILSESEQKLLRSYPEDFELLPLYQRFYPLQNVASHLLGYLRRRDNTRIPRASLGLNEYLFYPYSGAKGVEKVYDEFLSGKEGVDYQLFDSEADRLGGYKRADCILEEPVAGETLQLSIDSHLQSIQEKVLDGVSGTFLLSSLSNGEILSFISKPNYSLSSFLPWVKTAFYNSLLSDPGKALLNRATHSFLKLPDNFNILDCESSHREELVLKNLAFSSKTDLPLPQRLALAQSFENSFRVTPVQILKLALRLWSKSPEPNLTLFPTRVTRKISPKKSENPFPASCRLARTKTVSLNGVLSEVYEFDVEISAPSFSEAREGVLVFGAFPADEPKYTFVLSVDQFQEDKQVTRDLPIRLVEELLGSADIQEVLSELH